MATLILARAKQPVSDSDDNDSSYGQLALSAVGIGVRVGDETPRSEGFGRR